MATPPTKQVVLVGGGHAHLHVIAHTEQFAALGAAVTLISPNPFWYSGLATGMLGGAYQSIDDQVDVGALVEAHGGRFVDDRVVGLDAGSRRLQLEAGGTAPYDVISFNVGSTVRGDAVAGIGDADNVWSVKPISNLWRLRCDLIERFERERRIPLRVVVLGGGATGCEVAGNIDALARRHGATVALTLLTRGKRLIEEHPSGAARRLTKVFARRGFDVVTGCAIKRVEPGLAFGEDGRQFAFDALVVATGLRPGDLMSRLGLPTDAAGGLRVDAALRSVEDDRVFAVGDCAALEGYDLPKVGVFGVRQAPVLLDNLMATLRQQPCSRFQPQRHWLTIMNLGDGRGLAVRGRRWWLGRSSLWLKDWIDRRFLRLYRVAR